MCATHTPPQLVSLFQDPECELIAELLSLFIVNLIRVRILSGLFLVVFHFSFEFSILTFR